MLCVSLRPSTLASCKVLQATNALLHRRIVRSARRCNSPTTSLINPFELAWGSVGNVGPQDVAAQLFAFSIIPYSGFLYCLTKSQKTPPLALRGFYFLLVFVFATIPAGIYAKTQMGTTLANVDWLHGPAESLLTMTNLLIVLGFRRGILQRERENARDAAGSASDEAT